MANIWNYDTVIGKINIVSNNGYIENIFLSDTFDISSGKYNLKEDDIIKETNIQIQEYLCGKRYVFQIPHKISGTFFQKKVLEYVSSVPYGEVVTYSYIAEKICCNGGCRAVGNALNKNPLLILIPCHRVVLKSGKYGGFAYNKFIKEYLINLEKTNK